MLVSVGELEVIEIRLTSSPTDEDIARITQTAGMLGVERATLISHAAPGSVEERLVGEPRGVPDACMSTALHQGSVPAAGHGA